MAKRPLLLVGAGAVVITVLEGIACGNPVAPRHHPTMAPPADAAVDAPSDGTASDGVAPADTGTDAAAP